MVSLSGSDQDESSYRLAAYGGNLSDEDLDDYRDDDEEDGDEEGLIFSRSRREDEDMAARHGSAYARFKSKILRDLEKLNVNEDTKDDSDDDLLDEDDRVALEDGLDDEEDFASADRDLLA